MSEARPSTGDAIKIRRVDHGMPGNTQAISAPLVNTDENDVGLGCIHVGSYPRIRASYACAAAQPDPDPPITSATHEATRIHYFDQCKNAWCSLRHNASDLRSSTRELAQRVCLVDNFTAWEDLPKRGYNDVVFLGNCINHPVDLGHDLFFRGLRSALK